MSTPSHTKQMTSCPQCGSDVMPEMIRCRECGTMLHEQQSAAASSGSLREEKPQNKITTCRNCGEEMRSGMSRCRNCGHVPLGTKPHSSSVKLADSASWAADLFNSVPLEEAPLTLRPTVFFLLLGFNCGNIRIPSLHVAKIFYNRPYFCRRGFNNDGFFYFLWARAVRCSR